jgi:hypothetical protein
VNVIEVLPWADDFQAMGELLSQIDPAKVHVRLDDGG